MRSSFFRAIFALGIALPAFVQAQVVSVTGGAPQTQTFDSLASTGTTNTSVPTGWFFHETSGTAPANVQYAADNGASNSGNTYSYGSTSTTERAFGGIQSNTNRPTIGAQLQNDTGSALTELQVEYDGEQWRIGTVSRPDRLDFEYSTDATSLTTGTWTAVDTLDFPSPNTTSAVGALDGNANTASKTAVISGLSLAAGAKMWVRWSDFDPGSNEDGLAIDNVVFSIPGPPIDIPPTLSSSVPTAGAPAVARDQSITLTFSESVTTTGAWYTLVCSISGTHAATVTGAGATRTIDPTLDFDYDEDCTLTLDPAFVLDEDAPVDALAGETRVSFHTALEPVDIAPTVSSFTPANAASNVPVSSSIVVKFSEAVTVGANWYTLSCATSGAHTATVTPDSASQYTVNPDTDFGYVESCTFTVNGAQVTDLDGTPDAVAGTPATTFTTSAAPGNYYGGVDASSCAALRTTLHATIDDHTAFPYTHGTLDDTWTVLEQADQDPLDSSHVLEVYENVSYAKSGGGNSNYNREHTWPNSYGFNNLSGNSPAGVPQSSAYTDTHMLYLSDIEYNSDRGSKPFATCSASCTINVTQAYNGFGGGSQTYPGNHNWYATAGSEPQGSYEVWNHRRGDVARAVLYMDIRYEGGTATGGNTIGQSEPDLVVTDNRTLIANSASTTGGTAYMGLKSALVAWHNSDAPDAQELLRNDVVFSYQGNRNPFIDHPEWVAIAFADPCTGTPPTNQAPTLGDVSTSLLENAANGMTVTTLAGSDPDVGQVLTYSIISGNASGAFAINGTSGAVTVANTALVDPAVAASYSLTVRATDNGTPAMSDDATLSITVTPVNDAPSFTKGADATVAEDAGAQSVTNWATAISAGAPDESGQTVSFEVTANTNTSLLSAAPSVATNGTLSYTPAANANGTATITLRARDTGGTANGGVDASATQTFVINVNAVDDAPVAVANAATFAEDAAAAAIDVLTNDTDIDGGTKSIQSVTDPAGGTVVITGGGTGLTYQPDANFCSANPDTFQYTLTGGSSATVSVTVSCVNDAPAFTAGANQSVNENSGAQSVGGWATAISTGPANESGQAVSFEIVSNSNTALFSTAPAVAANGTLTYTSGPNQFGVATIQVRALDDGGTANGGVNASPAQSFTITVVDVVNQASVANNDATTVLEDSGTTTIAALGNDTDAEADPFVVTSVTQPANGTAAVGPAGANVTFTPAADFCGTTTFDYTITGGDTATVNVTVTCVNDAPVLNDRTVTITAGAANGTLLAALAALDVDSGGLTYAITGGNTGSAFSINPTSGAVTVASSAAVTGTTFSLTITVSDGTLDDTATITVNVVPGAIFADGFE